MQPSEEVYYRWHKRQLLDEVRRQVKLARKESNATIKGLLYLLKVEGEKEISVAKSLKPLCVTILDNIESEILKRLDKMEGDSDKQN